MSRFDINKANDFAALTLGSTAGIFGTLNAAFGRKPEDWDIIEGSYNGVLFHIFQSKSEYQAELPQVTDTGGRRKIKYKYPYKDGQTTEDLGRKPDSFQMEICIHGQRYMQGFTALLKEFNKPTPGTLIHPVRGSLKAVVEDYTVIHNNEKRKALLLNVTFIEHSFTQGDIRATKDKTVKGALARAIEGFTAIQNAFLQVTGAAQFGQSLVNQIGNAISEFNAAFGTTLADMNTSFNGGDSTDIPGLLPANLGTLEQETDDRFQVAATSIGDEEFSEEAADALTVEKLQNDVNARRQELQDIINSMEDLGGGQGALEFYDTIVGLKNTAILLQEALEAGAASSQAQVIKYKVPRLMSIREVAFLNGISVERVNEIDQLNPELLSVNFIEKDTILRVPTV